MKLKDILYGVPLLDSIGDTSVEITEPVFDSRQVAANSLFVAVPGTQVDGHRFIAKAISEGANSVVCEKLPETIEEGVTYLQVKDSSKALAILAANFYDNPSGKLKLVGITGTNGKTTVATLLYRLYTKLGHPSGLLSTVNVMIGNNTFPATHTTPDPLQINKHLARMVDEGCEYAFMEVSSHGLAQNRTVGLTFAGAVFTNISHDHLDYHKTFENYLKAKKKLFDDLPKESFALVNRDDKNAGFMLQNSRARQHDFALKSEAEFKVKILEEQMHGMLVTINQQEVWTQMIGYFNAYNLTAVYGVARLLGADELQVATAISKLHAVDGRFQQLRSKSGVTAIIDYAHTPDALENVLETITKLRGGAERLITVVGCGGNRDKDKRPQMARLATDYSDRVVFTSDNPRDEDPETIIREMEAGVSIPNRNKHLSITNRKEGIKTAIMLAEPGDIVLIAGKGHEKYQEIKGERIHFDDLELAREFLNQDQRG